MLNQRHTVVLLVVQCSEEASFNMGHSGQRGKEKELKMGLRSRDKFEMAKSGQEVG